jgi:hypothetical protein
MAYMTLGEIRSQYPDACPYCGCNEFTEHGDSRYETSFTMEGRELILSGDIEDQGYYKPDEVTCNDCYATVWEKGK